MIIKDKRDILSLKYNDMIELECEHCHTTFYRKQKQVKASIKSGKDTRYCSHKCSHDATKTAKAYKCLSCKKEVFRTAGEIRNNGTSGNIFCSCSCAAKYNNSHNPNRKFGPTPSQLCKYCETVVGANKRICDECRKERAKNKTDHQTLKSVINKNGRERNKYQLIRSAARKTAKRNGLLDKCELCGYCKVVVCCHVKGIPTFSEDTTVATINKLSNLIGLCPNCHWELDHNRLSEENKTKVKDILRKR